MNYEEDTEKMERVLAMLDQEKKKDRKKAMRYYGPEIRKLNKELKALDQKK